jgi:hypothetical protein
MNLEIQIPNQAQGLFLAITLRQAKHKGMLRRRNMYLDSYVCEMCIRQREESLYHLFFRCPFIKKTVGNRLESAFHSGYIQKEQSKESRQC